MKLDNRGNIAFKFNYCNGRIGNDKNGFGFKNLCTEDFIRFNIQKRKATWCSDPQCPCRQFNDGRITYSQLRSIFEEQSDICVESNLLNNWVATAEYTLNNNGNWQARAIRHAKCGGLMVLTAVRPQMNEESRKIFGVALISEVFEGNEEEPGFVKADDTYRLEINLQEANDLNFWDFYKNENTDKCRWGQGMFRYITKLQAAQILKTVSKIKKDSLDEEKAAKMLEIYCEKYKLPAEKILAPNGARMQIR